MEVSNWCRPGNESGTIWDIGAMLTGRVSVRELILITMLQYMVSHGIFIIQNCGVMLFLKIAYHGRKLKALMEQMNYKRWHSLGLRMRDRLRLSQF